jgi:DNA-binding CsgD family transcriptional regulator
VFLDAVYGRPASYRAVDALHARTGGNPFFLEELLAGAGDVDLDELCDVPLPWSLAEAVRNQLEDLEADERRIVEAASVLGRRVPFDLLAAVTGCSEDDLIGILRSLVARGMMLEAENDVFSFTHALAQEAVEEELLGRERRRLHQAALDALRAAGSTDEAALANHARGAGRHADMVVAARAGAARYIAQGSTYQALQLAELGLSEADDDTELLLVAARAAWLAGLLDEAAGHADHLLAVARSTGDLESESAALRLIVRLHWELGDVDAMKDATDEVLAVIERLGKTEEQGRAMALLAQSFMLRGFNDEAVAWADQAIVTADQLGLPHVRVAAEVEKGSSLCSMPGRFEEGAQLLARVADEAEALGEHVVVARALHNQVRTDVRRYELNEARRLLERMRQAAERAGFDSMAIAAYAEGRAELAVWEGDLAGALEALDRGRRSDRGYVHTGKRSWYRVFEAGLTLELGDLDRAEQLRDALAPLVLTAASWFDGLSLHLACRRGDLVQARAYLAQLLDDSESNPTPGQLVHDVVSAALRAGMPTDALRPLIDVATSHEREPLPADSAWRSLLNAQLAEADHDIDAALEGFEDAAKRGEAEMHFAVLATAHVGAARCLIARGRADEARVHVAEAEAQLARWAGWRVDDLHAVQRRLGIGPHVGGPQQLTPREREVVALLAEGLTNAELADRLYISPKTAAVHVSNILAKLGMTSRTEVAAWAVREGH